MKDLYIICHMMTSVDGRIDCSMTSKLQGVNEYYNTLNELNAPSTLSGRVTAELEMALPGKFKSKINEIYGKENFSKKQDAKGYEIIVDTNGTLLWEKETNCDKPHLIITSEQVHKDYLEYLDSLNISWIVCGKEKIDLKKTMKILSKEFNIARLAIVGGGNINGAFLGEGLIDEISILIGPGIDGRNGMTAVFDGLPMEQEVIQLNLKDVTKYEDGAIWIRYTII